MIQKMPGFKKKSFNNNPVWVPRYRPENVTDGFVIGELPADWRNSPNTSTKTKLVPHTNALSTPGHYRDRRPCNMAAEPGPNNAIVSVDGIGRYDIITRKLRLLSTETFRINIANFSSNSALHRAAKF